MRRAGTSWCVAGAAAASLIVAASGAGPDVVVSELGPEFRKYGTRDLGTAGSPRMVTGYAAATVACNIGDAAAAWVDFTNQHPVIAQQLYRLHGGRFEQIGLSWVKHSFCAADNQSCIHLVPGAEYRPDLTCATLGLFAFDVYSATLNGQQYTLGPRSEIDPSTGQFPYPFVRGWNSIGDCLYKRLQVHNADLSPQNFPGARYFFEAHYITPDEAAAPAEIRGNNAGYREVLVGSLSAGMTGTGCTAGVQGYGLTFTGLVAPFKPAIEAWRAADPGVTLITVDVPGAGAAGGRIMVGARASAIGGGMWQYEYAVYNHNVARGIGSVTLPKSSNPDVLITQVGFHDVEHHSGEPYSGADWTSQVTAGTVSWSTTDHAVNPDANAIRWGTLYNFRFQAARAPATGTVTIGLFKPGLPDDPASVRVAGLPVPTDPCLSDFDGSGGVTLQDLFDFLGAFFAGSARADVNGVAGVTVQDLFDYLDAWFGGC